MQLSWTLATPVYRKPRDTDCRRCEHSTVDCVITNAITLTNDRAQVDDAVSNAGRTSVRFFTRVGVCPEKNSASQLPFTGDNQVHPSSTERVSHTMNLALAGVLLIVMVSQPSSLPAPAKRHASFTSLEGDSVVVTEDQSLGMLHVSFSFYGQCHPSLGVRRIRHRWTDIRVPADSAEPTSPQRTS